MTLKIDLPPDLEQQLRSEAAREGQDPEAFVRSMLEERLSAARARQIERNQGAIALLDRWLAEPPDLEEAEGYPTEITPLSLREVSVD